MRKNIILDLTILWCLLPELQMLGLLKQDWPAPYQKVLLKIYDDRQEKNRSRLRMGRNVANYVRRSLKSEVAHSIFRF